ncbi:MAG: type II secretion system F family protein [Candidatus Liberibacter ctenarytainae]|uniref:Type II secretion system F family protein n=1 Tax=Candidatus Liberibacter ctenarytainae TaxID=2020335 RepID=A0A937AJK6_9HYPH|nr:type II secretion system F family protein [Candidatus Liberibacter ctenarytainae]
MHSYIFSMFDTMSIAVSLVAAIAVFSLLYSVIIPLFDRNELEKRKESVALERESLRQKQRIRLAPASSGGGGLRSHDNTSLRQFVTTWNLRAILVDEQIVNSLRAAGFRSEYALNILLIARLVTPIISLVGGIVWIFGFDKLQEYAFLLRILAALFIGYAGLYAPSLYISNLRNKRQALIKRAWPDALDLLLICVESGISIDLALRRVADEIGGQSIPLSEEMLLTTAELSFLPSRQKAFENFYNRTQMDCIRNVMQALIQSDRYGTSIGDSLRVLVEENRAERMTEAEKKAAALSPKLTVPMILFFLPVLLMIILGPGILTVMDNFKNQSM